MAQMAISSLSASAVSSFTHNSPHSSSHSSLSSLHFPVQLRPLQLPNTALSSRSSSRTLHVDRIKMEMEKVAAKKQTYSSLDELLQNSDKPVLVDFYATWCGPCQFMVPILNEVSTALKDKVQVVKIDTEKYPAIGDKYNIAALPTFIIFKDGKPHDRFEGALTKDQLIQRVENSLNSVKQ